MDRGFGRNVLLAAVSWLVPAVVAVVAVPITVNGLGADLYGVMALVGAVAGYLGILDLGLGQGFIRYLAMFVALDYGRAMRECLRAVFGWFAAIGVVGAAAIWLAAPWLAGDLLKVPDALVLESILAFRIGGLAFALGMVVTVLQFVPEAFLRYGRIARLNVILGSISLAGPAVLVSLGYGLLPLMWFGVAMTAVSCFAWGAAGLPLLRQVPNSGPGFRQYVREFLGFASTSAANRIWGVIQAQTSKLILGMAKGTAPVTYFSIPAVLSQRVTSLLYRMSTVLLPTGSQMEAAGERGLVIALYERSSRLFFVLNASVTASIVAFSDPLLRYWVGSEYADQGALALQFLTLAAGLNAVSMAASQVNLALGRPKVNLSFSLVNSAINLSTVYFLTVAYGIAGTALSGLLAAAVVPPFLHYTHSRIFHISTWRVVKECYLSTVVAVSGASAVAWFVLLPLASNLGTTLALATVTTVGALVVAAVSGGVTREDWVAIRAMVRSPAHGGDGEPHE